MNIIQIKFENYYRSYSFYTKLNLREGQRYKIKASGAEYATPVRVMGYVNTAPAGIVLKEITEAEEYNEDKNQ